MHACASARVHTCCLCVYIHATVWGSKVNFEVRFFLLFTQAAGIKLRLLGLQSKCLYPLGNLANPLPKQSSSCLCWSSF